MTSGGCLVFRRLTQSLDQIAACSFLQRLLAGRQRYDRDRERRECDPDCPPQYTHTYTYTKGTVNLSLFKMISPSMHFDLLPLALMVGEGDRKLWDKYRKQY